jgi:hypothetical protein
MNKENLKMHARSRREDELRELREGRKRRGKTQQDKGKVASKQACRKGNY